MKNKNFQRGFTLIELSIVIIIIGILMYGFMGFTQATIEMSKITLTKQKLDQIEEALNLYQDTNLYLPCPADIDAALNDDEFGAAQEEADGVCDTTDDADGSVSSLSAGEGYAGVVPVRTLNLPDDMMFDAWGNRILFAVDNECIVGGDWTADGADAAASFCTATAAVSHLTVNDNSGLNERTNDAAYVLVSFGKNTAGSRLRSGQSSGITNAGSSYEPENYDLNDVTFQDDSINDGEVVANYFDDYVRWKTGLQISFDND